MESSLKMSFENTYPVACWQIPCIFSFNKGTCSIHVWRCQLLSGMQENKWSGLLWQISHQHLYYWNHTQKLWWNCKKDKHQSDRLKFKIRGCIKEDRTKKKKLSTKKRTGKKRNSTILLQNGLNKKACIATIGRTEQGWKCWNLSSCILSASSFERSMSNICIAWLICIKILFTSNRNAVTWNENDLHSVCC